MATFTQILATELFQGILHYVVLVQDIYNFQQRRAKRSHKRTILPSQTAKPKTPDVKKLKFVIVLLMGSTFLVFGPLGNP